jgi:DNA (cytosine-5)-methyltransferase 1
MRDRPLLPEGAQVALPKGQAESGYPLVLCGGFPCQDLSIAGRQVGLTGERSGLWLEFKRAIEEIRPDFVVIENVAHTWRRWVPSVREDLGMLGYASLPLRVRASDLGAPHQRARIFLVAHADSLVLWKLQRWWVGPGRQVARELVSDGKAQYLADAAGNGRGEERQEQGGGAQGSGAQGDFWGGPTRSGPGPERVGWWAVEPGVGRVADGVPERVDRLRALGNAIVPQIAQVIARGIKEVTQQVVVKDE